MKSAKSASVKAYEDGLLAGLRTGKAQVPTLLLTGYRELGLTDTEAMLLIHLILFAERERNEFPTPDEIAGRMSAGPDEVMAALSRLIKAGFLSIEEGVHPVSGVRFERYGLDAMYSKLVSWWAEQTRADRANETAKPQTGKNLFTVFEKEFARPLTPMELEMISGWLDQDGYSEDLIRAALKEAVFAGKVHFRYIDRILLEWQRNRIVTVEQAKEHRQKFRGRS